MKKTTMMILSLVFSFAFGQSNVENVNFVSHEIELAGSIVWPDEVVKAAVVFVHGSGAQQRNLSLAKRFATDGIAALVYDKRGVGESGGEYESQQSVSGRNIELLADDALAALQVLVNHSKTKQLPLGLTGISQAGWIVPLAAEKTSEVDFLVLWSAPVSKVSEEDIYSKFTKDQDGAGIPSYKTALQARKTPYVWPDFLGTDTSPTTSLKKINIPGLWIFGKQDGSIPVDLSIERLNMLSADKKPFEHVLFSNSGHNNMVETIATANDWIMRTVKSMKVTEN